MSSMISACVFGLVVFVFQVPKLIRSYRLRRALANIPSAGEDGVISSYATTLRWVKNARAVLSYGYNRYKDKGFFKIPQTNSWVLIATGPNIEDLRSAPDASVSLHAAMEDLLQPDYTLGKEISLDMYHLGVLRNVLTKKLSAALPGMCDEISLCFKDMMELNKTGSQWTSISANDTFTRIICRVMNRTFIGAPLCRNEDYLNINIYFAHHVMFGSAVINLFPNFLKPVVGAIYNKISGLRKRIVVHVGPLIEERQKLKRSGDPVPDDMLTWLMEAAPPNHRSIPSLSLRLLNVNFMALHTTAMTFTHALFHLAARTEYIGWLRSELEEHLGLNMDDWSKEKLEKCWKLDSFLRESQRLNGLGAFSLPRKTLVPYKFSDGTVVPAGVTIAAAPTAVHLDPAIYEDPEEFDGFRFYRLRMQATADSPEEVKHRLTSTSVEYLGYGGGRHACPGRFFAALEVKLIFAYLILHYDVRTEKEGVRPPDFWFGPVCTPSLDGKVLFKCREVY